MIDFAVQRLNMVESQLRPCDITDRRILRAMGEIRREAYLPAHVREMAYMDEDIRISGSGRAAARYALAPRTLALLIQLARIEPGERVLEIGCGSGYATAVMSRLAGQVVAVDSDAELAQAAIAALAADGIENTRVVVGPMGEGHAEEAPYDAIVIDGALAVPPVSLLDQLKDGGRMVAIQAADGMGRAVIWHRYGMHFDMRPAFDARAVVLPGFESRPVFSF